MNCINNTRLIFGIFDGVHIGHRAVINMATSIKDGLNTAAVILKNNNECTAKEIYTIEEKVAILKDLGINDIYTIPLSDKIQKLTPEEFISKLLVAEFHPSAIAVGKNCRFGKNRYGNIDTLKLLSEKFCYKVNICDHIPDVTLDEIKKALTKADMIKASVLLGQEFTITGEVVHGKALGRTVGMPTANILPYKNKFIPAQGVYATLTEIGKKTYIGITNIGIRPSVDNRNDVTIENHIFDFDADIYGQVITLKLCDYIRGIKKFNSINEVKEQVTKDIKIVKKKLEFYSTSLSPNNKTLEASSH